jgi:hypothetical protein
MICPGLHTGGGTRAIQATSVIQVRAETGVLGRSKGGNLRAFVEMVTRRRCVLVACLLGAVVGVVAPAVAVAVPGHGLARTIDLPSLGDAAHAQPASAQADAPTACAATITGAVNGGLVVAPGERFCLIGARVNGSVSVPSGSGLIVEGSTINGGLRSTEGASEIRVCASRVNGTTTIQNGRGKVLIGAAVDDGGAACPGNTLHGGVTIGSNVAAIEIESDWITGPVTLVGNEGAAFEGSDVGAEIELNRISGPLTCASNSPAPVDDGLPNTVTGPETGQCVGF